MNFVSFPKAGLIFTIFPTLLESSPEKACAWLGGHEQPGLSNLLNTWATSRPDIAAALLNAGAFNNNSLKVSQLQAALCGAYVGEKEPWKWDYLAAAGLNCGSDSELMKQMEAVQVAGNTSLSDLAASMVRSGTHSDPAALPAPLRTAALVRMLSESNAAPDPENLLRLVLGCLPDEKEAQQIAGYCSALGIEAQLALIKNPLVAKEIRNHLIAIAGAAESTATVSV